MFGHRGRKKAAGFSLPYIAPTRGKKEGESGGKDWLLSSVSMSKGKEKGGGDLPMAQCKGEWGKRKGEGELKKRVWGGAICQCPCGGLGKKREKKKENCCEKHFSSLKEKGGERGKRRGVSWFSCTEEEKSEGILLSPKDETNKKGPPVLYPVA